MTVHGYFDWLKATSHSTIFDMLMRPVREDQMMPTGKRAMLNFDLYASDAPESLNH